MCPTNRGSPVKEDACAKGINMNLNEISTRGVVTAAPLETLSAVALRMQEHNVGTVVVVEDRRPVGIVTDRDLALALGANGVGTHAPVLTVMTPHVLAIPEYTSIDTATKFMKDRKVRRLPIVDREDRLVGIVTLDDLLRVLGRELYDLTDGIKHEMEVK